MKQKSHLLTPVLLGMLFLGFTTLFSCKKKNNVQVVPPASSTIVDIVSSDPRFTILKAAVVKAGLAGALSGTTKLTVFAPTDDAFKAAGITAATVTSTDANALKSILQYHVVAGLNNASSFPTSSPTAPNTAVTTLQTTKAYVSKNTTGVFVNGSAKVVQADLAASNGIIHVIDHVLAPQGIASIIDAAKANSKLSLLVAAVVKCDLVTTLTGAGTFTVFAPTNDAFTAAGYTADKINSLNAAGIATLKNILTYHVVSNRFFSSDLGLAPAAGLPTLQGQNVTFSLSGPKPQVKGASNSAGSNIGPLDIPTDNGVVHVIDQVLLPK